MARYIHRLCLQLHQKPVPLNSVRNYGRWMHRKPGKVTLPFEPTGKVSLKKEKVIDLEPEVFKKVQNLEEGQEVKDANIKSSRNDNAETLLSTLPSDKRKKILSQREERLKKRLFYLSQKKVFDENGDIIFEKLKENDGRVSTMLVKLKSKKNRLAAKQTLVEGWRLIVDGLEAKCKLQYVIFSRLEDLDKIKPYLPKTGVVFYKMLYKEMQLFSDVETSSGIFGVFEIPSAEKIKSQTNPIPLQVICDNIRMPGNLGAILRVLAGAGCEKILLTKGCVDVWDPKVIRSAAGAHFRLPIHHSLEWPEIHELLAPNTSIFIADSNTNISDESSEEEYDHKGIPVLPYYSVDFPTLQHTTLVVGGETEGISEDSYLLAAKRNGLRLNIPIQKGVDSLNTGMATAIIAFEIRKQLIQAWRKINTDRLEG